MAEVPLYFMIGQIFPGATLNAWLPVNGDLELLWSAIQTTYFNETGLVHPCRIWNHVGPSSLAVTIATGSPTTITYGAAHNRTIGSKFEINLSGITGGSPSEILNGKHTATVTGGLTVTIPLATTGTASGGFAASPVMDTYRGGDDPTANSHTEPRNNGVYPSVYWGPDVELQRHITAEEIGVDAHILTKHTHGNAKVAALVGERGITSIVKSGTDLVFTLSADHGKTGTFNVVIWGVIGNDPDLPNGTWSATYVSANQFSIALDSATVGSGGRVSVSPRWSKQFEGNGDQWDELVSTIRQVCDFVRDLGDTPVIRCAWVCVGYPEAATGNPNAIINTEPIQGVSVQTDTVTITLSQAHGRATDTWEHITLTGISGLTPAINGEHAVEITGAQTLRVHVQTVGTPTLDPGADATLRDPIYDIGDDLAEFISDLRDQFVVETGGTATDYPIVVLRPEPKDEAYGALNAYAIRQELPKGVKGNGVVLLANPDMKTNPDGLNPTGAENITLGRKLWNAYQNALTGVTAQGNGAVVYVALGQSQWGAGNILTALTNNDPLFLGPQADELIWSHVAQQFEDYDTQSNNSTHPLRNTTSYGPACSLLHELKARHPSQPVYLLLLFQNSSTLGTNIGKTGSSWTPPTISSISVGATETTITMVDDHDRTTPFTTTIASVSGPNAASINGTHTATPTTLNAFTIPFGIGGSPVHTGGTALIPNPIWNKAAGDLWPELETAWADVRQWLFDLGLTANVNGVFWLQGESDTIDQALFDNYQDNLTQFIADVRELMTTRPDVEAEVPFVICQLIDHENQQFPADGVAAVRAAQTAVASADAQASLVNLDSLPISTDKVHLTGEACFDAGELMIKGLDLVSDDYDPGSSGGSGGLNVA